MYSGDVIDVFMHSPWTLRETTEDSRGHRARWEKDPRLSPLLEMFHHDEGEEQPLEATFDGFEEAGVTQGLFVAAMYYADRQREEHLWERYEELQEAASMAKGDFQLVGSMIPPEQGPGTYWDVLRNSRHLQAAKEEYDIRGVDLHPAPWGTSPNHKWFYPGYATCVELDLPVVVYVGIPAPAFPARHNNPIHLDELCLAFPDLTVVAHHIGDPWVQMMTHLAGKYDNLYICTAGWSPKRYPPELIEFMEGGWHGTAGRKKVLFGTAYPHIDVPKAVHDARRMDLPEDVLEDFLYNNAKRLFWGT